jgi:iron complex outermembrane recepter protein
VTLEFFGFPAWTVQAFSMDDVERIEVIRGPGSALYGANAYAGVVNVINRAPGSEPRASFSLRGGERGQIEISLRSSEKIGALSLAAGAGLMRADLWSVRDTPGMNILRGQLSGRAPRFEDRFRLQLVQE